MGIGEKVKTFRESKGLTQVALAETLCISQPMLCALETRDKPVGVFVALRIHQLSSGEVPAAECVSDAKRARVEEMLRAGIEAMTTDTEVDGAA